MLQCRTLSARLLIAPKPLQVFYDGTKNLVYAETRMNKHSSRSHAILQIRVTKWARPVGGASAPRLGRVMCICLSASMARRWRGRAQGPAPKFRCGWAEVSARPRMGRQRCNMQQCNIRQPACMVATCDVHAPVQAEGAPKDGAIAGTVAKLSIVDLAGSERLKKCGRSVPDVALHCVCGVLHIALRSVAGLPCSCRMSHVVCCVK